MVVSLLPGSPVEGKSLGLQHPGASPWTSQLGMGQILQPAPPALTSDGVHAHTLAHTPTQLGLCAGGENCFLGWPNAVK